MNILPDASPSEQRETNWLVFSERQTQNNNKCCNQYTLDKPNKVYLPPAVGLELLFGFVNPISFFALAIG